VDDDADDARARRAQGCRAAIVDIADRAGVLLDALARGIGDQRAVAQGKRNRRGRNPERIGDGR